MVDMGIGHKAPCQIDVDNFWNVVKETNDKQSMWHVDMLLGGMSILFAHACDVLTNWNKFNVYIQENITLIQQHFKTIVNSYLNNLTWKLLWENYFTRSYTIEFFFEQ
jgi:hypothetical protein